MLSTLRWPTTIAKFLAKNRFRKEITLVIVVKLIALFLLWEFFIAHPATDPLAKPALVRHFVS
jgi:uncharacterized SAM-binding protein YcdF (DUF218 family)